MLSNKSSSTCAIWRFKVDRTVLIVALTLGLCALIAGLTLVFSVGPMTWDTHLVNDHTRYQTNQTSTGISHNSDHPDHKTSGEVVNKVWDAAHNHSHDHVELTPEAKKLKEKRDAERAVTLKLCRELIQKYGIEQGLSWGTSDAATQQLWKDSHCDDIIGVADYDKYLASHPSLNDPIPIDPTRKSPVLNQNVNQSIAICVCTTTRGVTVSSLSDLSLFNQLVPSIVNTIEPGFEYWLYIAYDKGDTFFDNAEHLKTVTEHLQTHLVDAVQSKFKSDQASNIHIGFTLESFENILRKPGPAFNYLTQLSYLDGADYIYRINDDSSFSTPWAHAMIDRLLSMGLPYGVVGPLCREGNTAILTHDLVHRVHHEIFHTYHYPPSLTDWWMDDWVTRVYGRQRTVRMDDVIVKHATSSHGTRYAVDYSHAQLLSAEVERGRIQIEKWMLENGVADDVIDRYKNDEFHFHI